MNLYEIMLNADRVGEGMTHFERLFAQKVGALEEITIGGIPPLTFLSKGDALTDYLISGNTVQDGTPSPDMPVDVVGCGVRTENLVRFYQEEMQGTFYGVDVTVKNAEITLNGTVTVGGGHWVEIGHRFGGGTESSDDVVIPCEPDTPYTIATEILDGNSSEVRLIAFGTSNENRIVNIGSSSTTTFIDDINRIFISLGAEGVVFNNLKFRVMLNLGSTALPYEPYGYKLPLTVNGTEYPIYLGTVPTTRRIKKLVLTGEEGWQKSSARTGNFYLQLGNAAVAGFGLCDRAINVGNIGAFSSPGKVFVQINESNSIINVWIFDTDISVADFQSYLAAQYAAGTPVTVWYVLATEETTVVNEPLMKIGDYADTISFAQADVTIPTVSGINVLDVPTEVPPSEVSITGNIKEV